MIRLRKNDSNVKRRKYGDAKCLNEYAQWL